MGAAETQKSGLTDPSSRLEAMPPYMFAELERRIAEKQQAGIDVISLGIGDPDQPTYPHVVKAMQEAVADGANHGYPSNRGRPEFRSAFSGFYSERFGVDIDPETEVIPAIGAKECIYNLCFAFLDPGDVALASDPGYPVYTGGPILAGAEAELLPLVPELSFVPDLAAVSGDAATRARLMFINYPNNPTGAVVPEGFFERVVSFARENEILVVHDNAYSETTFDGYVAPSFLATPGAKEVGVEVFSLSKGFNMTGWRCAAILGNAEAVSAYWRLKTNIDSGLFDAVQLAGAAALEGPRGPIERMNETYARRRDIVVETLRDIGVAVDAAQGDDLRLGAGARGADVDLVRGAGARAGRGRGLAGLDVRPQRRGLFPHFADHARRPPQRSARAHARAPRLAPNENGRPAGRPSELGFSISLLADLDLVDHALEGVWRAALAVADEAVEDVLAGLQVQRDELAFASLEHGCVLRALLDQGRLALTVALEELLRVGGGGIANRLRGEYVMRLRAGVGEENLVLSGLQAAGLEAVVDRLDLTAVGLQLLIRCVTGDFDGRELLGIRRAGGTDAVIGPRLEHLGHDLALAGRGRPGTSGGEEPLGESLALRSGPKGLCRLRGRMVALDPKKLQVGGLLAVVLEGDLGGAGLGTGRGCYSILSPLEGQRLRVVIAATGGQKPRCKRRRDGRACQRWDSVKSHQVVPPQGLS